MIIATRSYGIIEYPETNWILSYERMMLESGNFIQWDRGLSADRPLSTIQVKGPYSDLIILSNRLSDYRETITFEEGEYPFGPHIDLSGGGILCYTSNIRPLQRVNSNLWLLQFTIATELPLTIRTDITANIDDLFYPSEYVGGRRELGDNVTISSYGDYSLTTSHTQPVHKLTFSMDIDRAASMIKYFIEDVRDDAFTLPLDWQSLNPFAGESYTHAIVLDLNFNQQGYNTYNVTLDLQGYNNG